ncbi:MAG: amidohydrolase family protein [Candidatus Solibacter sp.]
MGGYKLETIIIRGARNLVTMRGARGPRRRTALGEINVIPDGAILIRDGLLQEVGPSRRVENLAQARDAIEINAAGRVVMPSFVDAHTHVAFPPPGIDVPDRESAVRALHAATGHRLEARTRTCLEAMARHGTTTAEVKTGGGLDEGGESKLLRVLQALRSEPLALVPTFFFRLRPGPCEKCELATEWMVSELLPKVRRRGVAPFADLGWESDKALLPHFERYLQAARQLGFELKIHADGPDPAGAIELAIRHQVSSIDHLEYIDDALARRVGEAGLTVTLVPNASFDEQARVAPARALIEAGAAIALGSNFNLSHTPTLSMQTVVALASGRLGMTLEEALSAATINSAYALGCGDQVGSLEPGKSADLLILNAGHYRDLGQSLGTNLVHLAMKGGKFIYREANVAPLPAQELELRY